jgi:hypothetical protein
MILEHWIGPRRGKVPQLQGQLHPLRTTRRSVPVSVPDLIRAELLSVQIVDELLDRETLRVLLGHASLCPADIGRSDPQLPKVPPLSVSDADQDALRPQLDLRDVLNGDLHDALLPGRELRQHHCRSWLVPRRFPSRAEPACAVSAWTVLAAARLFRRRLVRRLPHPRHGGAIGAAAHPGGSRRPTILEPSTGVINGAEDNQKTVFKTVAFVRSAILPQGGYVTFWSPHRSPG